MNRVLERLAIAFIMNIDKGMVTTATSDSIHEIQIIIATVPTIVSTCVSIWDSVCWRLCAMLSMSFVTRLSRSPRCARST